MMKKRMGVNWKLLTLLFTFVLFVGGVGYWLYQQQRVRAAESYRQEASKYIENEEWYAASQAFFRYLSFHPSDADAWFELAGAFDKSATKPAKKKRCVELHLRAIGIVEADESADSQSQAERLISLRKRLAELYLDTGDTELALQTLRSLPDDLADVKRFYALARYQQAINDPSVGPDAAQKLLDVVNLQPERIRLAVITCQALRKFDLPGATKEESNRLASSVMDRMVDSPANEKSSAARLSRYDWLRQQGSEADPDLEKAIKFAKAEADDEDQSVSEMLAVAEAAIGRAAVGSTQEPWLSGAMVLFGRVLEVDPTSENAIRRLGDGHLMMDQPEQAVEVWTEGIEKLSEIDDGARIRMRLADSYLELEDFENVRKQIEGLNAIVDVLLKKSSGPRNRRSLVMFENQVDLLRALLHIAENEPKEAMKLASSTLDSMPAVPTDATENFQRFRLVATLGSAYSALDQWGKAAAAYEQAASLMPGNLGIARRAAQAWRQVGDSGKAVAMMSNVAKEIASEELALIDIAELQYERQAQRARNLRDWSEFEQTLQKAADVGINDWRLEIVSLLRSLIESGADRQSVIFEQVAELGAKNEQAAPLWRRIARIYQRFNKLEECDLALEQFREITPDEWRYFQLKAEILTARDQNEEALVFLEKAIEGAPAEQENNIRSLIANIFRESSAIEKAKGVYQQILEKDPNDITALGMLAELTLTQGDEAATEKAIARLREAEGDEGVFWRFIQANFFLRSGSTASLRKATDLQREIVERSPSWSRGHVLLGAIEERFLRYERAADAYEEAIRLNDRRLLIYQRLLRNLYQSKQFDKAEAYLTQIQDTVPNSNFFTAMTAAVAEQTNNLPAALLQADAAIQGDPSNPIARIWKSQLLLLSDDEEGAEKELREAVKLSKGEDLTAWITLFRFYLVSDPDRAKQLLETLESKELKMPIAERALLIGGGWASLGESQKAEEILRSATEQTPEDVPLQLSFARILGQTNPSEAESLLRRIVKENPGLPIARRSLAIALSRNGTADSWQELQQLLALENTGETGTIEDVRLKAHLLFRRGGRQALSQARILLSEIEEAGSLTPMDQMLIALSMESEGKIGEAEKHWLARAEAPNQTAKSSQLPLIQFYGRQQRFDDAFNQLIRLEASMANAELDEMLLLLRMRLRLFLLSGRESEIEAEVKDYFQQMLRIFPDEKLTISQGIGQILLSSNQFSLAESWLRQAYEADPKMMTGLSVALSHLGRHDEALDLILEGNQISQQPLTIPLLTNLLSVLSIGLPDESAWLRTNEIWNRARADQRLPMQLIVSAALMLQDQEQEAISLLEGLLKQYPDESIIQNNLATLLAQTSDRKEEALTLINKAIEARGEKPFLLDTKSIVLVGLGKADEAVTLLGHLVHAPNPDPRVLFRLAAAQMKAGDNRAALQTFERAKLLGLESTIMSRSDRVTLGELNLLSGNHQ